MQATPITPKSPTVGASIRAVRKAAGMTLQQVCDEAGISLSYLSRVENGEKTPTGNWVQQVFLTIGAHLAIQDAA